LSIREANQNSNMRFETFTWKWMRYSAILLIPLAWGHVMLQDVLVGGFNVNLDYVALRFSILGWRIYDFFLLAFAFAHGMNGLRQVIFDYVQKESVRRFWAWLLLLIWLVISLIGGVAIIGGVRLPPQ
jgi:succinate dehydrogenase membrane anchor subunit